jgi:diguanylate cyclase (GGDEF)-like protein
VDSKTQDARRVGVAYGFDIMEAQAEDVLKSAVTAVGDVAYHWSIDDDLLSWSSGAEMLLGISDISKLATHRDFATRLVTEGLSRYELICRSRESDTGAGVPYELEYQVCDDFGGMRWVEDRGRWFAGTDGAPAVAVGVLRAIDERHKRESELIRLSTYDELTGLLNRVRLKEALTEAMIASQRGRQSSAFLLIAVDNLALINDAFGFDVADEVIVSVGERLKSLARRGDSLGRYAGNKFGLVLRNCNEERLGGVCERMLAEVRDKVVLTARGPVAVTVSAGSIALPGHASSVDQALARAEEALIAAKQRLRDSHVVYTPSREREKTRLRNINVADELITALNDKRIRIAFQPIVDATTGEAAIHECLVRMEQPDGGIVSAGHFVPVAEKLGIIGLLDYRVMELAVDALRKNPGVTLSLNVSGRTTADRLWRETLASHLRADSSLARRLVIEITETVAIHEVLELTEFVAMFRELGCKIAIDDFGAGYTSFRNLKTLDVDLVKIDGSFVIDLATNPDNQFFVRTLVDLARNFNLPTVAEWVSNAEEVEMLKKLGVQYLQGFYLGEPVMSLPRSGPSLVSSRNIA